MSKPAYRRVLLKLSGESLAGRAHSGLDNQAIAHFAEEIHQIAAMGVQLGVVVGGGNIFRGLSKQAQAMERVAADYMGMLATVINCIALQDAIEKTGTQTRLLTAIEMNKIAEPFIRRRAVRHLEKGRVVLFAAGTGNPYFTTDTAAALRAVEIGAEILLKGTRVDGVYDADPEKVPTATKYDTLAFDAAIQNNLRVMDQTALTLCKENDLPIIVFNIEKPGNLLKIFEGEKIGTYVGGGYA